MADSHVLPGVLYVWLQQQKQRERLAVPPPAVPSPDRPPAVPDRDIVANLRPIRLRREK